MLSRDLHGHAAMGADMYLRLSEALCTNQGYLLELQAQSGFQVSKEGKSSLSQWNWNGERQRQDFEAWA